MRRILAVVTLVLAGTASAATFTKEVLVLNSAVTRVDTTLTGRRAIEIQNLGPNAIYCAVVAATTDSADAVLTKSRRLNNGEAWALDLLPGRFVYCRAATADQITGAATVVTEVD